MVEDEIYLEHQHNPFYQWGRKGKTPIVKFKRDRDKKTYFFGALSLKYKTEIAQISEEKKSKDFIEFLDLIKIKYQTMIEAKLPDHLDYLKVSTEYKGLILIVLDGDSCHTSKEVKKYLDKNYGIFELYRLPTYSPDLNPQEHVWKALRKDLAKTWGKYTFTQNIDKACRFLLTKKFDYQFI